MENINDTTKGTEVKNWEESIDAKGAEGEDFISKEAKNPDWHSEIIKNIPEALQKLESNLAFTIMIISVVGYIVIASFGQMNSFKKYIGYILFLIFIYCAYKLLKGNFLKFLLEKINKLLLSILLFFIIFVIIQNFHFIIGFLNKIQFK